MKKNDVKKLQLARETLKSLTAADIQNAVGGDSYGYDHSCLSGCGGAGVCTGPG